MRLGGVPGVIAVQPLLHSASSAPPYKAGSKMGNASSGNAKRTGARGVSEATKPVFSAAANNDRPVRSPSPVI
ncbi:hypothetical protein D3C87_1689000 [compost metagenome]